MTALGQKERPDRKPKGPRPKALHEVVETIQTRTVPVGDCLIWTGAKTKGYGMVMAHVLHPTSPLGVHRVVFLHHHGYLPQKPYEVSHLCDTPLCINIDHLVEETHQMNMDRIPAERRGRPRKPTCGKGHEFTPENTQPVTVNGSRTRRCRECARQTVRDWRARQRAAYYAVRQA